MSQQSSSTEHSPDKHVGRSSYNDIASHDQARYLRCLGSLPTTATGAASANLIDECVRLLRDETRLSDRVRSERLKAILRRISPDALALVALADASGAYPPALRMVVSEILPPPLRARVQSRELRASDAGLSVSPGPTADTTERPTANPQGDTGIAENSSVTEDELEAETIGVVAILSKPETQDSNKSLLQQRRLGAIPWDSVEKLERDLRGNADICGCVIDRSILRELDEASQRSLFELVGGYSSFLWIRVDEDGLKLSRSIIKEIVKDACCARGPVAYVDIQPDSLIRPSEIDEFLSAADKLRSHVSTEFVPAELDSNAARLLVAAAREYWNHQSIGTPVSVRVLETRFISGGRSGAITIKIRINRQGQPLIAKIGPREFILEESKRMRTFVELWDRGLHPVTFLHSDWGVILFGMVTAEDNLDEPAGTLEEVIESLWNAQVFGGVDGALPADRTRTLERRSYSLADGLRNVASKLQRLNSQAATASAAAWGNPWVTPLDRLESEDVLWHFDHDISPARARAKARLARLATSAVVHGDIHLRNVLVRGDRDAHLIDFASCGPGHPGADLARFEVALFVDGMRQLVPERRCVEYQRALSLGRASADQLAATFSDLIACHVNVACSKGCATARDAGIAAIEAFQGTPDDYLAIKYLVACQTLLVTGRATGMARAIVEALTPTILSWQ